MHENRTTYPKKKVQMYQQLQELPKKYNVLALVRMEKVRGSQLLPLRKKLQGEVEIVSIKDKVAKLAFAAAGITGIDKLSEKVTGQCVFMFTNMSPFKLNVLLGKNKVMLFARGGDVASMDVVIPPKNTGIAPGPMLTDFKENNIPTKIDQGTIWIMKETIPVKKGEPISEKLAGLLTKLDIKAIEAGIVLNAALFLILQIFFTKALEPSSFEAYLEGPNTFTLFLIRKSTNPLTSGSSGPTITKSILKNFINLRIFLKFKISTFMFVAILLVPALPGKQKILLTRFDS